LASILIQCNTITSWMQCVCLKLRVFKCIQLHMFSMYIHCQLKILSNSIEHRSIVQYKDVQV